MTIKSSFVTAIAVGTFGLLNLMPAKVSAATLSFGPAGWTYNNTSSSEQPGYIVSVNDNTAGFWNVSLSIDALSSSFGDMLFFGFDSALTGLTTTGGGGFGSFAFGSSSNGEGIAEVCAAPDADGIRSCGSGGGNFNGALGGTEGFDYIVRMGNQGLDGVGITSFDFSIATNEALTATGFTRVGIRAQSVGSSSDLAGQGGSTKDIHGTGVFVDIPPVPLPAAGWLLLAGVGGLAAMRRRKT